MRVGLKPRTVSPSTPERDILGSDVPRAILGRPVYLDCAATTPIDPRVQAIVLQYLSAEFGNAGSRTHQYGLQARRAVEKARDQVARVVGAKRGEVIFTSGATESNNLALLGLADHGLSSGKRHIVSTRIEHHAVLEPLQALADKGFTVSLVAPNGHGWVEPEAVREALRDDTLLVSVMHVNNETGVVQPLSEIASVLTGHAAYFHVDAAQGFGKEIETLRHPRIDLISVSGHKIHAPKGIGALIARRRKLSLPPLKPLMYGGGQERGLRPGTLPVHLAAGLGYAAELALREAKQRHEQAEAFRLHLLRGLKPLAPVLNGDPSRCVPHILNISIPGFDAETVMEAWKDLAAVSDGAACTSQSYTCSHVLSAMGLPEERKDGAVRLSWCHLTELPDVKSMVKALERFRTRAEPVK
jgi:cysteine desulfurase